MGNNGGVISSLAGHEHGYLESGEPLPSSDKLQFSYSAEGLIAINVGSVASPLAVPLLGSFGGIELECSRCQMTHDIQYNNLSGRGGVLNCNKRLCLEGRFSSGLRLYPTADDVTRAPPPPRRS